MRGFIDIAEGDRIEGWVQDMANPDQPVLIDVVAQGRVIGRAAANIHRPDLAAAGIGDGRHAFRIALPDAFAAAGVTVRRHEDGALLPLAGAGAWLEPAEPATHPAMSSTPRPYPAVAISA